MTAKEDIADEGTLCPICHLEMIVIPLHFHMHDHKELVEYLTSLVKDQAEKDDLMKIMDSWQETEAKPKRDEELEI